MSQKLRQKIKRFFGNNSLSLALFGLFIGTLYLQSLSGVYQYNQDHASDRLGYWTYLKTGSFLDAVFKNWQAAVLQLGTLILLGASLHQKGASHSREPGQTGTTESESEQGQYPEQRKGFKKWIYEHSFSLAFFLMFAVFLILHIIWGTAAHNEKTLLTHQPELSVMGYFLSADCWFQAAQTWQAEFFAIALFVILSVFLRQKGSAESKPVESRDDQTGPIKD